MSFKKIIIVVIIASLVGGGAIGAGYQVAGQFYSQQEEESDGNKLGEEGTSTIDRTPQNTQNLGALTVEEIVKSVGPSVVSINSKVQTTDVFRNPTTQQGLGSGVVFQVGEEGIMILTNQHVVENAQEMTISFEDTIQAPAKLVGSDVETDLAVIQIEKKDIPEELEGNIQGVEFGDSEGLTVGERAIAMGNPLGYNDTVTVGVISALDRELQLADKNMTLIQTDAAINPGNSGGALLNGQGQLVGINTIKIADTQVEGIGFAIPINYAKPIIEELLVQGYVSRPFLGIVAGDVDEQAAETYDIPIGVLIHDVMEGSGAHKAGITRGDVIIEIDGEKILTMEQLTEIIGDKQVGDTIEVIAVGNGEERKTMTITLQEKANN